MTLPEHSHKYTYEVVLYTRDGQETKTLVGGDNPWHAMHSMSQVQIQADSGGVLKVDETFYWYNLSGFSIRQIGESNYEKEEE